MRKEIDKFGRTDLHYAANEGRVNDVKRLLSSGANVNRADNNGWTPLHFAAQSNCVEVTSILIAAGAELEKRDSNGNTPLFRAVFSSKGNGEVIAKLRDAGADSYAKNDSEISPVSLAYSIGNYDIKQFFSDLDVSDENAS